MHRFSGLLSKKPITSRVSRITGTNARLSIDELKVLGSGREAPNDPQLLCPGSINRYRESIDD
jgi:hypothetical protein